MNRKVLSLLLVVVMLLSIAPTALPVSASNENSVLKPKVVVGRSEITVSQKNTINPENKINPLILEALKGEDTGVIKVINGEKLIPAYLIATKQISIPREIKVFGHANIDGFVVYNLMIPVKPELEVLVLKLADRPEVKYIGTFRPELAGAEYEKISVKEIAQEILDNPGIRERIKLVKKHRELVESKYSNSEILPWKTTNIKIRDQYIYLPKSKKPKLAPDDYYVVTHHGAKAAWETYGVDGSGVKISIVDTGVDFGNPALMDAYAVDENPNSPYYGWPLMYDPGSLFWYSAYGVAFPYVQSSWYSDTDLITGAYGIAMAPYTVGWVNSTSGSAVVVSGLSLANVPDEAERSEVLGYILSWIVTNAGSFSRVLVVDDDGGASNGGYLLDVEAYYLDALNDLGVTYDKITVPADEPIPDVINNYDLVLWFTGEDSPFVTGDTETVANYLSAGGKLILFSSDLVYQAYYDETLASFMEGYLHVNVSSSEPDLGIPTVLTMDGFNVSVRRYNMGVSDVLNIYIGVNLPVLIFSFTDLADMVVPTDGAEILSYGYFAVPTFNGRILWGIRLPMDNNLNVPLKNGTVHLGAHPDIFLAAMNHQFDEDSYLLYLVPNVLVADTQEAGKYDKVYVALTTDWGMFIDFNDDPGHGKDNPVIAWDVNGDGLPDISGGLVYYIADGEKPIPYSDVYSERWHVEVPTPKAGSLVAFMMDYYGIPHGTGCASSAAARGDRVQYWNLMDGGFVLVPGDPNKAYYVYGTAPSARVMAVPLLSTWASAVDWMEAMYFSAEGYDGVPGTGDEAQIVSNSYGNSYTITKGFSWDDRFLYYLTTEHAPTTIYLYAAGNGGPGYGTVTDEGASPGVITVGAATEGGYRIPLGLDASAEYADVVGWSNRGPNGMGKPDVDVVATGAYGAEADYLNYHLDGRTAQWLFSGTSMATPVAAGITALVYEAFYKAHGRWPTSQEAKEILMSTAENINHDIFSQGAGYLNATKAVELALGKNGLWVSPTLWQPGKTDYPAFPNIMYPGESATKTFTLRAAGGSKSVRIEPMVFKKIDELEIPVTVSNESDVWIDITDYIPQDTELLRVTMYSETFGNPFVRLYFVTDDGKMSRVNEGINEGNIIAFTVHDPLKRAAGRHIKLRIYPDDNYPATIKLEFYKREPWDWVKVTPESVYVSDTATFMATITVPEDTPYGIYEGAIYVRYSGHEITIPVSVVVASPTPNFKFGGENRNATGLYDNSHVYGAYDWGWRYETGDWRFFYFNSEEEHGSILVDVKWPNPGSDINVHVLGPKMDEWSQKDAGVFGPYTLVELARGMDGHLGDGKFTYATRTGGPEEIVGIDAGRGLHSVVLHNVLINASVFPLPFSGEVGVAKAEPYEWKQVIESLDGEKNFTVKIPEFVGSLIGGIGLVYREEKHVGVIAPPTGGDDVYQFTVSSDVFYLKTEISSPYPPYKLDLDIELYYYNETSGSWEPVGSSESWGSDEEIKVSYPAPGTYILRVISYSNNLPGTATYDVDIVQYISSNVLTLNSMEETAPGTYNVTLGYHFVEMPETTVKGIVLLVSDKGVFPVAIPVTLIPKDAKTDLVISSINVVNGTPKVGDYLKLNVTIKNLGDVSGEGVLKLYRDGVEMPTLAVPISVEAKSTVPVLYEIPVTDSDVHEYKVVLESDNDYDLSNNVRIAYAGGMPENYAEIVSNNSVKLGYTVGKADITNVQVDIEKYEGNIEVSFEGEHGALVVVYVAIPAKAESYTVSAEDADVLSYKVFSESDIVKVIEIHVRLHSPGKLKVSYKLPEPKQRLSLAMFNFLGYRWYNMYKEQFNELYKKALEMNVSNETLQKALELHNKAAEHYGQVLEIIGDEKNIFLHLADIDILAPLRKAYVTEMKAVKLLRDALKEAENPEG